MSIKPEFNLSDKYLLREGKIILTGLQALVRIPIDQYYYDKSKGLNTATLIAGYRGSPLGIFDMLLKRNQKILNRRHIVFNSSINEDLAAASIWGSQMTDLIPGARYDGVKGIWYGKGPGVDRSGDAFRHANFAGVGKNGGVLAFGGDDPISKSSTIPSASEWAFHDAMFPVLYPGNIQEVINYGKLGFELSRYSGLWVGYKCTTDLMDGFGTAEVSPDAVSISRPAFEFQGKPWEHIPAFFPLGAQNVVQEAVIADGRMNAAKAFIATNKLNVITHDAPNAKIGFIAAGKTYYDLLDAFRLLNIEKKDFAKYGFRLLKLGAIYPIEKTIVHEFARGLEKIVLVEEKRNFIENQVAALLYHAPSRPTIVGKQDQNGAPLFPSYGEASPDLIANTLLSQLEGFIPQQLIDHRLAKIKSVGQRKEQVSIGRTPYYCSGCPHNTSTMQAPEGAIVGAGIGCHTLVVLTGAEHTKAFTHMGGEGAQWVGLAPFVDVPHFFQNIGDGTFAHSGSLAIRHAIANKINITFKILYNGAVAMTGGQAVDAEMSVPAMTRSLEAEGVKKIIVTTDDLNKYPSDARWALNVERMHRDNILEAQNRLKKIPGVTVLIHDQGCAAELRRARKKGNVEAPKKRIFINEEVCEGCNDCGVKSNCLSVKPIETEFGRKTTIDQSSCNLDFSCIKGDCPSFIEVIPGKKTKKKKLKPRGVDIDLDNLPVPKMRVGKEANIYMMGVGGTGVVTVNHILGTAAMLDHKEVNSLDQIGLSQKGGAVVSHFKIVEQDRAGSNRIAQKSADAYIGFDILTASKNKSLIHARQGKTLAVISTDLTPTGLMLRFPGLKLPEIKNALKKIEQFTDSENNVYFDAVRISKILFGNHYPANIMLIGAAWQAGTIPIAAEKIEEAIKINGLKVSDNIMAFRVGRRLVLNPELAAKIQNANAIKPAAVKLNKKAAALIETIHVNSSLKKALELRTLELIAFQNYSYAKIYVDFIQYVAEKEQSFRPGAISLTEAVIKNLYKLMAYKDEYEVARLHTKTIAIEKIHRQFGAEAKFSILLHPPVLRAMGYEKKIRLGRFATPILKLLKNLKFLRGTAFDLFGHTQMRKTERALIVEYKESIKQAIQSLNKENYDKLVELANLPDMIRGYEGVKMANVRRYKDSLLKIVAR